MNSKGFHRYAKYLATILLIADNLYYATTQPGIMDPINGAVAGIVFYAIWFAEERQK